MRPPADAPQRARRPEDKADRRAVIKAAAAALLDEGVAVHAVNMATLMARTGLAKGTAYLYYPTREALLLDVLVDELEAWFAQVADELPAVPPEPEALAGALTRSLVGRPRLVTLLGALHAVLEANIDPATARGFKGFLAERIAALDVALRPVFPGFGEGDVARLLLRTHALVVGLVGMARPGPAVAEALADPALAWLRVDLATELEAGLAGWLRGGIGGAVPGAPAEPVHRPAPRPEPVLAPPTAARGRIRL